MGVSPAEFWDLHLSKQENDLAINLLAQAATCESTTVPLPILFE